MTPWDVPGENTWGGSHSLSRGSSWPRDQTCLFCLAGRFFTSEPLGKPKQPVWPFKNINLVQDSLVPYPLSVFPLTSPSGLSSISLTRAQPQRSPCSAFIGERSVLPQGPCPLFLASSFPLPNYSILSFSSWFSFIKWNTEYVLCSSHCIKNSHYRYRKDTSDPQTL